MLCDAQEKSGQEEVRSDGGEKVEEEPETKMASTSSARRSSPAPGMEEADGTACADLNSECDAVSKEIRKRCWYDKCPDPGLDQSRSKGQVCLVYSSESFSDVSCTK